MEPNQKIETHFKDNQQQQQQQQKEEGCICICPKLKHPGYYPRSSVFFQPDVELLQGHTYSTNYNTYLLIFINGLRLIPDLNSQLSFTALGWEEALWNCTGGICSIY